MPAPTACRLSFGFNHCQRLAKLVAQQEVRTQSRLHIALGLLAAHHDATGGDGVFTVDLIDFAPARLHHGWADEFCTNVGFTELLLVHAIPESLSGPLWMTPKYLLTASGRAEHLRAITDCP